MENMKLYAWMLLCLVLILGKMSQTDAKPAYDNYAATGSGAIDRFDYDYFQPYTERLTQSRLSRLRRGYYFIDDGGYITAVSAREIPPANRRQDTNNHAVNGNVEFTPLVKYKHTRTKRKKLFVPNLFG